MRTILAVLTLLLAAGPLAAQHGEPEAPDPREPAAAELGDRVRVTPESPAEGPVTGQFVALRGDSLVIHIPRRPRSVAVALDDVRSVEVSLGHARARWSTVGAATGAMAGVVYARAMAEGDPADGAEDVTVVVGGLLTGALIGWLSAPERWRGVRLPGR
jgi:hypothetical protein